MKRVEPSPSTFDQYLREIGRVPLLKVEEERELGRQFREGDRRAGHRLVEANLRFVVKVAFEYRSYGLRIPDLVQEGNLGLMKAVQKFDPDKKIRLISYAVWWIRAYIQNHILKSWSLVKIGTTQAQRRLFFSLARARNELERLAPGSSLEAGIDPAALAKRLKVRPSDVLEMTQRMDGRDVSLDAQRTDDGDSTLLDLTPSPGESQDVRLGAAQEEALIQARVNAALARLDPRERHIVQARLMGDGDDTLRELGLHFGFSRERARQIEIRAIEKLRRDLEPLAREVGWGDEAQSG